MRTITSAAERIRHFNKMAEKNLVSPPGRVNNKNDSSSPLDRTVAETPSPGGNDFSPESVKVKKVVDESPVKPFDEGKDAGTPNFESVWDAAPDNNKKVVAHERMNKTSRPVNADGRKPSFHAGYFNRILTGDASPESIKERVKAPVPFLSTGSPIEKASSSLSDEIALAQKMGMEETLATAPESTQRALMMQSRSPPAASPSYPIELASIPLSPAEDSNPMKPHSLFQSSEKAKYTADYDKIDEILDRGLPEAKNDYSKQVDQVKSKPTETSMVSEDGSLPFDCSTENMSSMNDLEEGTTSGKMRRMLYRKFLRNNDSVPVVTLKKEHRGSSNLTPNEILRNLRENSIDQSESRSNFGKSKKEKFEDETFSPLAYYSGSKNYNNPEPMIYTIPRDDSTKGGSTPEEKRRKCGTRTALYLIALVILLVIGIIAGLVAGGKVNFWSKDEVTIGDVPEEVDIVEATMEATFIPTQEFEESNVFEGSSIKACSNAVPLTEMNQPYYGSNWKAFWDVSIDTCGDQMSTGYSVWYSFTTNSSKLVEASTCDNADFDTQITVMSGSCDEKTCVSFNDQGCGDQSLVTWYAEANTTYYIMVHGFREASGTFGLTLSEAVSNDQCKSAVKLQDESVVAGTTAGATSFEKPPECGDVDISGDGVWYEIDNISGFYKAELLLGYTEFEGQVAVYRSMDNSDVGCGELMCEKGSSTGSALWLADAAEKYYVYVTGKNETAGDFDLFLGRNKDASCTFGTRVDASGVGFLASTRFENPQNVESCGYTGYHTAPGLWFSVIGTGQMLEASTCGSLIDLDTQISVFKNSCDALECIGGTGQDYPCGDNGSVAWQTEEGEVYNIYVSGRSSRVGDFVLTIDEVPVEDGFMCDTSFSLELGSTSFQSNTTAVPSESVDLCTGTSAVRGSWHKFMGTGTTMKISVSNAETNYDARVSLFTGSCGELSCVSYTESIFGENDEIFVTTHVGVEYYLLVHGPDSVSIGNYLLSIEEATINDSCAMASPLQLMRPSQYFGSTLSASNSTAMGCSGETDSVSDALWYTFEGTGEVVTLSTCSENTDFQTDIRVFSGTCSEFACVPDISERRCGDQSVISFQSTVDEIYYARIGGLEASDAGNFVLEVNRRSRFFGA